MASETELTLEAEFISPWDPLSHCYLVKKRTLSKKSKLRTRLGFEKALDTRIDLIKFWDSVDRSLTEKTKESGPVYLFGAGEYAQILSCYAANTFKKIDKIIVTVKNGARDFEKPIYLLDEVSANEGTIVLGVRPEIEDNIKEILVKKGWRLENIITVSN
ncbi:hypothetical protein GCM10009104_13780 [Marinobacterium maritimum]|uniref:Uncharacterized protein n=2 Tax=Marinobacterium maritimum TaxID=500162 RepID=A0ABP3TDL5_9GAMM